MTSKIYDQIHLRILRTQELAGLLGVHRSSVWRWRRDGHLPRAIRLSPRGGRQILGWRSADIIEWIATRPEVLESHS